MIPAHWLDGSGAFYFTLAGAVAILAAILIASFFAGRFSR